MISISVIPAGTASATSQELAVEIVETSRPYCTNATIQPYAAVSFKAGDVTTLNGNAVVPVTAIVSVTTPGVNGKATTQLYSETFELAFAATTANTVTITPGASVVTQPARVKCCKANAVRVLATLEATIA